MRKVHLSFKLLSHRDCHLCMEVLRSFAFIAVIWPVNSRRRRYMLFISSANMSIGIVVTNTNTASSDTVLKPLIRLIAHRRYTENSVLLVVPLRPYWASIQHYRRYYRRNYPLWMDLVLHSGDSKLLFVYSFTVGRTYVWNFIVLLRIFTIAIRCALFVLIFKITDAKWTQRK